MIYRRYDKKMVDLHDKIKLLSDDIEKSDDDYNKVKKDLDNQLFLNKVSKYISLFKYVSLALTLMISIYINKFFIL